VEELTIAVGTFFSKYSMIQVYNTSKLFQEFHQISKDKVGHLQLTTRYINNFSFQNFLSVKDMNAKKNHFLNLFFSFQKYYCQNPIKNCIQQHANIVTDKAVTSVIGCF
jgi:hypothetical protein